MTNLKLLLPVIFILNSCSTLDTSYFGYLKNYIQGNSIVISNESMLNIKYSFIKISFGRSDAVLVLSSINEDEVFTWIGSNFEVVKTFKGIIVYSNIPNILFDLPSFNIDFSFKQKYFSFFANLYEPDLEHQIVNYELISRKESKDGYVNIYRKEMKSINWVVNEEFYLNNRGLVTKSIQYINPLKNKLVVNFYYQY
jgi:hypothetical protein